MYMKLYMFTRAVHFYGQFVQTCKDAKELKNLKCKKKTTDCSNRLKF